MNQGATADSHCGRISFRPGGSGSGSPAGDYIKFSFCRHSSQLGHLTTRPASFPAPPGRGGVVVGYG